MKKAFLVLLMLFVFIGIVGCEGMSSNTPSETDQIDENATYLSVTEAYQLAIQSGEEGTSKKQYVKGTIKSIVSTLYGEMYITDGVTDLYVYGVSSIDGVMKFNELTDKPRVGDEVYLYGFLKVYKDCPELGASFLVKLEPIDHSNDGPTYLSVTEAVALANQSGSEGTIERQYFMGTIKNISNSVYGEMYITDGVNDLYVYGVYSSDGTLKYSELEERPYSGDVVYLYGILKTYNNQPEAGASYLMKFESHQGEVDLSEYTQKTISEVRAASEGDKVITEGVVACLTYASGMKPNGFYLVDSNASIYVYSLELAGRVSVGQTVRLAGIKTLYIIDSEKENAATFGYKGSIQIQEPIYISSSEEVSEFDKSWISESSVKDILDTPMSNNITTNIYKVNAIINKVPGVGFVNYYINDLDNATGSYCYTLCNGGDFSYLDQYDGKICTVYLSAINCKATKSGVIYRLIPILVEENNSFNMSDEKIAEFALKYYAKAQFLAEYNSDPALEVLNSVSNSYIPFENVAISYASANEALVNFVSEDGKLIMHTSEGNENVTITITATYHDVVKTLDIVLSINSKQIPDTMSIADAIAAEDDTIVTIRGIVMSGTVNQTGFYLNDGTGVIAVRTDAETLAKIALGNDIVITGTKTHITKNPTSMVGQICVDGATLEVNLLGNNAYDTSTFITNMTYEEIYALINNLLVDYTTNVYVATCYIKKVEGTYSTNYYLTDATSTKDIYLYAGSGSQYSVFDALLGKELTVTFTFVNWNSKSPYRACIVSATDGETVILNNYNFR